GTYDFGLAAAAAPRLALKNIGQVEVGAPRWLDSVNLYYRLAYADIAQPRAYTQTKWSMPPASMVEVRFKERAAAGGAVIGGGGPTVRIELDEFSQVFTSAATSHAVLRARVTVLGGRDATVRQKVFAIEEPAASADGPGGAAALKRAAESLVDAALAWAGE
ncbi:MAG TPA: ABC-type transport auxiliary lipoprotein family protein, partial [Burkholderiales bacterium]|nr:ABC-type transport auxiliary lipoprotein family protein [Burkholderiales bacterium]